MATSDRACSINPYFKVHAGRLDAFRQACERFVARTAGEAGCLYYGFSFNGDQVHCREAYADGQALLAHLDNVRDLLQEAMQIADLTRLEIHGPAEELARLRAPLQQLQPQFFELEFGFRR